MDFEIPLLSRIPVPKLTPFEAMKHLEKSHNAGRRSGKIKVTGTVASHVRSRTHDQVIFDIEADGIPLRVWVPEQGSTGIVPGIRVVVEGRLLIEASNSTLCAVLEGHIVQQSQARRESAFQRKLPGLLLADFLAHKFDLVILGSERAIHDIDEQLKNKNCYPGPFRREIVRMTSRADVLAAVCRYSGVSQGVLFVRRGGEDSEFEFWSDPGFIEDLFESKQRIYIGLGRAEHRTALDSVADELFPTPMAAGQALAQALLAPRPIEKKIEAQPPPTEVLSGSQNAAPSVKEEFYLSNAFIWTLALVLGAIVLIIGLW